MTKQSPRALFQTYLHLHDEYNRDVFKAAFGFDVEAKEAATTVAAKYNRDFKEMWSAALSVRLQCYDAGLKPGHLDRNGVNGQFKGKTLSELMALPDPQWLVQDVLAENGLFEIFGQFKAGKTFFGMELALCQVTGESFFGAPVKTGPVLYIIAEGNPKMFGFRIAQWITERCGDDWDKRKRYKAAIESRLTVVHRAVRIDNADEIKALVTDNPGAWQAIFIDTLMRNMTGDPMKPADMIAFMFGCDELRNLPFKPAVIFLHHMRRENGTGGYGPIVGEAFVDGAATVTREKKNRIFQIKLQRDADDNVPSWVCKIESREQGFEDTDARKVGVLLFQTRGGMTPEDRILVTILTDGPDTIADLVTLTKIPRRTVDRFLAKLREAGAVEAEDLKLTAYGKSRAEQVEAE